MLRTATKGSGGACMVSAKVSVQMDPPSLSSPLKEGNCGRLRRMRTACPFGIDRLLTSATSAPPLLRIGSMFTGFAESNTSHTVSARRNNAAGVVPVKEKVTRSPSASRWAATDAACLSAAATAGGLAGAAGVVFGAAAAVSAFGASGRAASAAGGCSGTAAVAGFAGSTGAGGFSAAGGGGCTAACGGFAAASRLMPILACSATVAELG